MGWNVACPDCGWTPDDEDDDLERQPQYCHECGERVETTNEPEDIPEGEKKSWRKG